MSDHGINVTYKAGTGFDEFWITVGADDPDTWLARNSAVANQIAEHAANTATFIRAANAVARELPGAVQVTTEQAPAQPVASSQPVATAQPAQPTVPADAGGGALPPGVNIYRGPQADNPQYEDLYIAGVEFKLAQALKAEIAGPRGHKFQSGKSSFLKFNGKDAPYTTRPENESLVRSFIAANAHLNVG
jgi:hypothetical protein